MEECVLSRRIYEANANRSAARENASQHGFGLASDLFAAAKKTPKHSVTKD